MTTDDFMCLGFLEALESGRSPPDECDSGEMARQGLIIPMHGGGWVITTLGQVRLQNLRSVIDFGT